MKHSPRGRIKARDGDDPIRATDPMRVICSAHGRTTKNPCKQPAIHGGTVCRYHGGAAPQVKFSALKRLQALQQPAVFRLEQLMEQTDYPSTALSAVRDVLDRTMGKPVETQNLHVTGDEALIARLGAARNRTKG